MRARALLRTLAPRAALVTLSLAAGWLLLEVGASIWLHRFASEEQFRHYGTLDQHKRRGRATEQPITLFEAHRYLGFSPAPRGD